MINIQILRGNNLQEHLCSCTVMVASELVNVFVCNTPGNFHIVPHFVDNMNTVHVLRDWRKNSWQFCTTLSS